MYDRDNQNQTDNVKSQKKRPIYQMVDIDEYLRTLEKEQKLEKKQGKDKKNKVKNLLEKIEFLEIIVQGLKLFPRFFLSFIKKTFSMLVIYAISSGVSFLPVGVICWILSSLDLPYIVFLKILFPFSQIIALSLALQHIHETSSSDENSPELCFLFSLVSVILVFAI